MIAYLKGKIIKKTFEYIIVDVKGIGYKVFSPLSTLCNITEQNSEINLFIETIVREDSINLYGFLTEEELEVFKKLISVPKVGAKVALSILSGLSPKKIQDSIKNNNIKLLSTIPGIGKKTAERICFDLKDKFNVDLALSESDNNIDKKQDLEGALVSLGFKGSEVGKIIDKILEKNSDKNIEELLKLCLNELYNG